jgi:hypothetical protein
LKGRFEIVFGPFEMAPLRRSRLAPLRRSLTENEFLKKAVRNSLKQTQKKESSLPQTAPSSKTLKGGAS